jgi:hypothetical protein
MVRFIAGLSLIFVCALSLPAGAQQSSGIAGMVRDASGAVLPGATVEASSPALIEKVRTATTDGQTLQHRGSRAGSLRRDVHAAGLQRHPA